MQKCITALAATSWLVMMPLLPGLAQVATPFPTHSFVHNFTPPVNGSYAPGVHHHWDHQYNDGGSSSTNTANTSTIAGTHHWFHPGLSTLPATVTHTANANNVVPVFHHHWDPSTTIGSTTYGHTATTFPGINLNLASTSAVATAGHILQNGSILINVGGTMMTVSSNTLLTPAEKVAVYQITMSPNHQQSIQLNAQGSADGGTVVITPRMSQMLGSLTIPQGVTVIDLSKSGTLNLTGNLVDNGNLYITSTNPTLSTLNVNAGNINVQTGGLLSDVLPAGSLFGSNNVLFNINLDLNARNSISNAGTIASSGSLNLTAGSGNITNTGLVASTNGNINIAATNPATNINVSGTDGVNTGTFQAANGNINVGEIANTQTGNTTLTGGNYLSENLNINAGSGAVAANVEQVTGTVNINAGSANVVASTGTLNIGNENITGDPSFYNTAGNVVISGNLEFAGQDLAIVAEGNITNSKNGDVISTANANGSGGNIVMIAGANFTSTGNPAKPTDVGTTGTGNGSGGDKSHTLTISGGTAAGGYIDLTGGTGAGGGATPIASLTSAATGSTVPAAYGSGGNITMVAYGGTGTNAGTINVPSTVTINANGVLGTGGNVVLIAGSTKDSSVDAIHIGPVSSIGWTSGGAITLALATPKIIGGSFTLKDNSDGTVTGSASPPFATSGLTPQNTSMAVGLITTNLGTAAGDDYTVTFISGTGNVGTSPSPIALSAPVVLINSTGNVYLTDSSTYPGTVTISSTSHNAASVSLTDTSNSSTIIETGLSTTGAVALTNSGTNSSIELNGTINSGSGNVSLTTTGTGTISGSGTVTTTGTLSLANTSASAGNMTITSTNAPVISLNSTANVVISNDTSDVSISSNTNTLGSLSLTDTATSGTGVTVAAGGLTSSGAVTLSGNTVVINGEITSGGTVNITATTTTAAISSTIIAVNAAINASGQIVNLTQSGSGGVDNDSEITGSGVITANTLNVTDTSGETQVTSLTGANAVSVLTGYGVNSNSTITLNNGTTSLTLGSLTFFRSIDVTASGSISTTSNTSLFSYVPVNVSLTSSGTIDLANTLVNSNSSVTGLASVNLSGSNVIIGASLVSGTNATISGAVNITSTQATAGTGIAINAPTVANGQTVTLTTNGYDSGTNYSINEGGAGITAGSLVIYLNAPLGAGIQTQTAYLMNTNSVGTLSASNTSVASITHNVDLNNGSTNLVLGTFSGVDNLTVSSAGNITTNASFASSYFSNSLSLNGITVDISEVVSSGGTISITSTTVNTGTGIIISAGINAPTVNLTIGFGSADDSVINESGSGAITATNTLNVSMLEIYGATTSLTGVNAVSTLTAEGLNAGKFITLDNGTTPLTIGSLSANGYTGLQGLTVTSAGNISTTADYTNSANQGNGSSNYLSLTSSGTIDISNAFTFGTITLSGNTVSIGSTLTAVATTNGGINITSTETGNSAGNNILIFNGGVIADGQTVNLTINGTNSSGWIINEGTSTYPTGYITASTLNIFSKSAASGQVIVGLYTPSGPANNVGALNVTATAGPTVNVQINNGSNPVALGSFTNVNNLTIDTAGAITNTTSENLAGAVSLTGLSITISNPLTAGGLLSLLAGTNGAVINTAAITGNGVTITGTTDTIGATLTSTGTVNITSTSTGSGTGIAINALITAPGQNINLVTYGYDGAGYVITGSGNIVAGTLNITLNNTTTDLATALLNGTNFNNVGTLNVTAFPSTDTVDRSNVTLNNGTNALALGSMTNLNDLRVWSDNITTSASNTFAGTVSLNSITTGGGNVNISLSQTYYNLDINSGAITIGANISTSGQMNITSTSTAGGTGILINAQITQNSGNPVNLTADGYDGTGSNYVINEGAGGEITAGTVTITFNNATANTATAYLNNVNTVGTLNAQGQASPVINDVTFNNGSTTLNLGYLINITNFNLNSTGPVTFTTSYTSTSNFDFTTTSSTVNIDSGVTISANSITIDLTNGGTFNDNGSLVASGPPGSGGINIDPAVGLTLSGTSTYSPGAGNYLTFTDGISIALANELDYTVTNGAGVQLLTPQIYGASGGTETIAVSSSGTVFTLSQVSGGSTLELSVVSNTGSTTMNFNGAAVNVSATTSVTVDNGVTLSADTNSVLTINSPAVTVNGTVHGGGTAVLTTTLTDSGTITATYPPFNCCIGGLGNVVIQGLTSAGLNITLSGIIGGGSTTDVNFNPGTYTGSNGTGGYGQNGSTYLSGYGFGPVTINTSGSTQGNINASNAIYINNANGANSGISPTGIISSIGIYVNSISSNSGIIGYGGNMTITTISGNLVLGYIVSNGSGNAVNITANGGDISVPAQSWVGISIAGTLTLTASGNVELTTLAGQSVSAAKGIAVYTGANGTFSTVSGSTVSTTNSPIYISANALSIGGALNAGTSTVSLVPNGDQIVTVGGASTTGFDVSSSEMSNITAGTLIVGSLSDTNNLSTGGNINVSGSGAGSYDLTFNMGGTITINNSIDAAGHTLTLDTGAVDSAPNYAISETVNGSIMANNLIVQFAASSGTATANLDQVNYVSNISGSAVPGGGVYDVILNDAASALNVITLTNINNLTVLGSPVYLGGTTILGNSTIYSAGNSVFIDGLVSFSNGQNFDIISIGNITANSASAQISTNGGNLLMMAGATMSGSVVNINNPSTQGGNIDLSISTAGSGVGYVIDTAGTSSEGNVVLIALGNGTAGGYVNLNNTSSVSFNSVETSNGALAGGSVTIYAGENNNADNAIAVGNITTGGGTVTLYSTQANGNMTINTNGSYSGTVSAGATFTSGNALAGDLNTSGSGSGISGGSITVETLGGITTGDINTSGSNNLNSGAGGQGGSISLTSNTNTTVSGSLFSYGGNGGSGIGSTNGGNGGNGGSITTTTAGTLSIDSSAPPNATAVNASGGTGGSTTGSGTAGTGGAGGAITLDPTSLNIGGNINSIGGTGGNATDTGNGGAGGNGGEINLTAVATGTINGGINTSGGAGGSGDLLGGAGGAGGNIIAILTDSGAPGFTGGIPSNFIEVRGDVLFNLGHGSVPLQINGDVTSQGGSGGNALGVGGTGGQGGAGGDVFVVAGTITLGPTFGFSSNGGNGGNGSLAGGIGGNGGNGGNITLIANSEPTFAFITANGGVGGTGAINGTAGTNGTITIIIPGVGPVPVPTPVPNNLSLAQLLAFLEALALQLQQQQFHLDSQIGTRIATDYDLWLLPQYWPHTEPLQGEVEKLANNVLNGTLFAGLEFSQNELNALAANGIQIGPNSTKDLIELLRGNVMFTPNGDIKVKVREGIAYIPKGCAAYIMETGADSAIYDCHDNVRTGRIKVEVNGKKIVLAPGTQILLTRGIRVMQSATAMFALPMPVKASRHMSAVSHCRILWLTFQLCMIC
jgi:hypothetical protein